MGIRRHFICIGLIILFITGCSSAESIKDQEVGAWLEGPTKTVVDMTGREVIIPEHPKHIAALYATTGHIVTMLDGGSNIVAVNNGLKRDKLLNQLEPAIDTAALTVVSGQINIETMVDKAVDLAFIPLDMSQDEKQVNQLEKMGIPYIVADFQSIEEQIELVKIIGEVLDAQEEAKTYEVFYRKIIDLVDGKLEGVTDRVNVYHSINEANCTVAKGTLPSDWMAHAGGVNVSMGSDLEKDGDKYYTNIEQILLWNPEVIYCNESGVPAYILANEQWGQIQAVKGQRVVQLPVGISRWGHKTSVETPLAILWVAKDLYPESFADVDDFALYQAFYQDLFEFELTEEIYQAMLSADDMRLSKSLKEVDE